MVRPEMVGTVMAVAVLFLCTGVEAQHSKPIPDNSHIERNKFKQRDVTGVEDIVFGTDASQFDPRSACPQRIHLNWATEIEASAYVTPAIFDVASDGVKDVVIPSFIRHIEVLDGAHGQHVAGFPFTFPNSAFYSSPIIFDINLDGEPDIGVTSFNGELVWLSETGMPIFGKSIKIPHLRVRKDWYKGLKADPQDLEHTGLTEKEREAAAAAARLADDPFASGKLPTASANGNMWDNRDAGWGDFGPHKLADDLMNAADKDSDKKLSKPELSKHVMKWDPTLDDKELGELFATMDEDRDSLIDIRELTLRMDEFNNNRAEREFYNIDKNGDAKVDAEELGKLYAEKQPGLSEEKLKARFQEVDLNADGGIEMREAKEGWSSFYPESAAKLLRKTRRKKGVDRNKVAKRAEDHLQAVFRGANDKAELAQVLLTSGLNQTTADRLKALGIENVADLPKLTPPEIISLALDPREEAALSKLVERYSVKSGSRRLHSLHSLTRSPPHTSFRPRSKAGSGANRKAVHTRADAADAAADAARESAPRLLEERRGGGGGERKLLQADAAGEGDGTAGGGAERQDDSDVPLDDVEIPEPVQPAAQEAQAQQGENAAGAGVEEGAAGAVLEAATDASQGQADNGPRVEAEVAPKDGQELVDGENYKIADEEEKEDVYDAEEYWPHHRRYHDYDDSYYDPDVLASEQAKQKYQLKAEAWKNMPLSHNAESQWGHMRGFFAPEAPDSQDLAFRGEHIQKTILGHDEVFTRMMSIDKDVILTANRHNKSAAVPGARPREANYVYVDPHVLCTPIIADLDKDGADEIVFGVSYYFDKEQYSDPSAFSDLDVDVNTKKYVAGGVVAFDVLSGKLKWQTHLDLTTDETAYRAYIYSSPTVADMDNDGKLEIILGTSLGFLYVLDHNGKVKEGWPVTMAEIQGQVAVGDVNDDGQLELVATDNRFNVAVFNWRGKEVWEKRISGFSAQGPILGDINGDGEVDIVLCTSSGHIWALNGKTGETLHNFPVKAGGAIMSPPLLLQMKGGRGSVGPIRHVVVAAHDGYLYMVDGNTGCSFKVDIGENSYSMVLADDLTGNGKMDLLVTTMNGNVMCLGTDVDYHPLKAWPSREMGNNNVEMRDGRQGIYVLDEYRRHRDNSGATMMIGFEIVDNRPVKGLGSHGAKYSVRISVGGNLNLFKKDYSKAGTYLEEVPCPARRQFSTIFVEMTNEHGQHFEDNVAMSFNMHFYRALKWILLTPFIAMSVVLVFIKDMHSVLPF